MRIRLSSRSLLQRGIQILQADPLAAARGQCVALARIAPVGDLAGDPVFVDDEQVVAGTGHRGETDDLDRTRRQCRRDVLAVLVDHAAHASVRVARDDRVADPQRSALDEHGRHGATTTVEVRLDGDTLGVHVRVGPQVERRVRGQQHRLEQRVDVGALLGGDVDEHGLAAELLGNQTVFGQLAADLLRVRAFLVDLVDRHHDRHVGRLRVVDRLHRLRHDAVVGRDHEDRDVGGLRTTGTHGGERLVTRGVDEGDESLVAVELGEHLVGTDVLGDAAGLALADVRLTDRVEQSGLTVVDVTHDGHHRRTLLEIVLAALVLAVGEVERCRAARGPRPRG